MRSRILSTAAAASLFAFTGCDTAKPTTETFLWKGPIAADAWLRLRNVSGDFEISETTGDSAEIEFVIERSSAYAPPASIKVLQVADGVLACAVFGDDNTCTASEYRGGKTYRKGFLPFLSGNTSVRGRIRVPRGVKLNAESVSGDITVTSVQSELGISTTNGDILIRGGRGAAKVSTTNGDVELGLDAVTGPLSVETTNGDVVIEAPTSLNALLEMQTVNGDLDLSVPANVTLKTAKKLAATLGTGGTTITLSTTNGDITLRERLKP